MLNVAQASCFGFYSGGLVCADCAAKDRCESMLGTHGFSMVASALENMLENLKDVKYKDTDSISVIADQIIKGAQPSPTDSSLEGLIDEVSMSKQDFLKALGDMGSF